MENEAFLGTGVALVTPFNEKLELDFQGLERLLKHTGKLDYLVVNGTTGESPTVSLEEQQAVLDFVVSHNHNQLPIMFGMGGNNTQYVVDRIRKTNFSKVQGILSVCPYYNKPTQEGIFRHYSNIADESPVPVYIYNVPGRTSCNIEAKTTLRLAAHPNIAGIKEAVNDMEQCMAIARAKPHDFLLISGDDMNTISLIKMGGVGVISVLANAFPDLMKEMVDNARNSQWERADNILEVLLPINPLMYKESNPVGVKKMLHILGVCSPKVRLPLLEATQDLTTELQAVFTEKIENKKSGI